MFSWWKRRAIQKQNKELMAEHDRAKAFNESTKVAEQQLIDLTKKMVNSHCPINNELCSASCVHFKHGTTRVFNFSDSYRTIQVIAPKCKLWK